ncbi:Uncharacterized conserved protein, DUF4415 family [Faunimonas pinastri]|uniref:Uncharacterized conserved protein, DUF4415 family n=1 Tax=Faunimonas pinastri TaxID=1855383 RepID=A0A1H9I8D6_9HYPH|nr:BrnA antitoxin family protein [Faunimonas pinastri]SEQ70853.1 Uncharacterized conserved protein, DUF4415 family [Faunimonas pinastri]
MSKLSDEARAKARALALKSLEDITPEEDAAIEAAAADDPDNPILTDERMARMRPAADAAPEIVARARGQRGPQKAPTKQQVTIRVDQDVLQRFKEEGPGWQKRMNAVLRKGVGLAG